MLIRPSRINEAWFAAAGGIALIVLRAIAPDAALGALAQGLPVYAFLAGMLILGEFAQVEGVFAWIASLAVRRAGRSRFALFALVYGAGILTTALLSNDATIVVLTPAVIVALKQTDGPRLPALFACAFVANAASFILPIANPSNLLVFNGAMPSLGDWLRWVTLPSLAAITLTAALLALIFRHELRGTFERTSQDDAPRPASLVLAILGVAAVTLVIVSAMNGPLGYATLALALVAAVVLAVRRRSDATSIVAEIPWAILPLTAALFVIVTAVDSAGALGWTRRLLESASPLIIGWVLALGSNLANNLPVGLNAGQAIGALHPAPLNAFAALIGVNLGPNLSTNGSLATILWLAILRRNGEAVSRLAFLRAGLIVTPITLTLTLLALR